MTMLALLFTILSIFPSSLRAQVTPDTEITASVEAELARDPMVPANLIHAETNQGVVALTGSVDNLLAKERAGKLAETVRGVQSVINRITVIPSEQSDKQILNDVKQSFRIDAATSPSKANVKVKGGIVTLTGVVDSRAEKQIYTDDAEGVQGVGGVENEMTVKEVAKRPDDEIKNEIERRLSLDVWVNPNLVKTQVKNRRVTLTGLVGTVAEKSRVYDDAWVAGVRSVDGSGLNVDPTVVNPLLRPRQVVNLPNNEVAAAVGNAFLHDPRAYMFAPEITVQDGIVTLSGTVTNLRAKMAMEQDAKNTVGVVGVKNNLQVVPPTSPSDKVIAQSIKDAFARDTFLRRQKIGVSVSNSQVKLSGQVQYPFQNSRAEDRASQIIGVRGVANEITVGAGNQ